MTQIAEAAVEAAKPAPRLMGLRYWHRRQDFLYYQVVRILATKLAEGSDSILDVGSHGSPYLEWFADVPNRTSLDLVEPYRADGITSVVSDFLAWEPDRRYDLVLCLQVLEHVREAKSFARKLLRTGRIVLISVPYRWPAGVSKNHVQDPVTIEKLVDWFGRKPDHTHLVVEPSTSKERLVCVFDEVPRPWTSLAVREGKRGFRPAKGVPPFHYAEALTIGQSSRALAGAVKRRVRKTARRIRGRVTRRG
jgi:hypothetical protein